MFMFSLSIVASSESNTESVGDAFTYARLTDPEFSASTDRCITTAKNTIKKIVNFSNSNDGTIKATLVLI